VGFKRSLFGKPHLVILEERIGDFNRRCCPRNVVDELGFGNTRGTGVRFNIFESGDFIKGSGLDFET
jgi:hypothetical protein